MYSYKQKQESARRRAYEWKKNRGNQTPEEREECRKLYEHLGRKYGLWREFRRKRIV